MEVLPAIVKAVLLPPNFFFILMVIGGVLSLRFAALGRALAITGLALLVVLSTPTVGSILVHATTKATPLGPENTSTSDSAIVILGAESTTALELGGETAGRETLERLRYAARLHRELDLPVLVTGGIPNHGRRPVGELMAETLEIDFGVPVRWQEKNSRNTYENALFSSEMLHEAGIKRVYLVTHALHMSRAISAFDTTGLDVIPAPVGVYDPKRHWAPRDFIPSVHGLSGSTAAIYEILGRLWYRIH